MVGSSTIYVRPAILADAEAIVRVHVQSWQESYQDIVAASYLKAMGEEESLRERIAIRRTILQSKQTHTLVAVDAEAVIGLCDVGPARNPPEGVQGEVYAIYLLEAYKRKGIGGMLLSQAVHYLQQHHLVPYMIWVLEANHPACLFYEKHGGKVRLDQWIETGGKQRKVLGYVFERLE